MVFEALYFGDMFTIVGEEEDNVYVVTPPCDHNFMECNAYQLGSDVFTWIDCDTEVQLVQYC